MRDRCSNLSMHQFRSAQGPGEPPKLVDRSGSAPICPAAASFQVSFISHTVKINGVASSLLVCPPVN